MLHHPRTLGLEVGQRNDLVRQPESAGFVGIEALAGQRIAAQLAYADSIRELRSDDRGVQSPAHLGDREHGVVGGEHDIAGRHHAGSSTKTTAMYERDGWQ